MRFLLNPSKRGFFIFVFACFILLSDNVSSKTYRVGPGHTMTTISDVPWDNLKAGDTVLIYWKSEPYREKWVINAQGTQAAPIVVTGVVGPQHKKPIIEGIDAVTASGLDFWNESRGIIKIGGSSVPKDGLPEHIVIENLEVRSGRPAYSFTNDRGQKENYANNAASIYVEKGRNITIRNCDLHDSGNGIFIGAADGDTRDILIEKNYIYDNGIVGRFYEHNTYTAAIGIIYQFNRFGPLRNGADGNNLKDRSAGLVVRYNWIEGGNRQLDLVDAEDSKALVNHPDYGKTFVYGNVLIEPDGDGNSQIVHYGGDSKTIADYRKGHLYFYNNTVVSERTGNTTLLRLSSSEETAVVFNNILYTTADGSRLAMLNQDGTLELHHNWLKKGWVNSHSTLKGQVKNIGDNLEGDEPKWVDLAGQDFHLQVSAQVENKGDTIPSLFRAEHSPVMQYQKHQMSAKRVPDGPIDIGAYEMKKKVNVRNTEQAIDVLLYPNPATDHFAIQIRNGATISEIRCYDLTGCLSKEWTDLHANYSTSQMKSGIYWVELILSDGTTLHQRMVLADH